MYKKFLSISFLLALFSFLLGPSFVLEKFVHSHDRADSLEHTQEVHKGEEASSSHHEDTNDFSDNSPHQHIVVKIVVPQLSLPPIFYASNLNFDNPKSIVFHYLESIGSQEYIADSLRPPIFS